MDTGCSEKGTRHPTHTGWDFPRFHCLHGKFTWRDWPWRQPFTKKKGWHWDARWNSQPVALCDEGAFQHLCFSALSHSLSAGKSFSTRSLMLFSIVFFNTVKILKCSAGLRFLTAKKAPFNYIIFHSWNPTWIHVEVANLFNIPGAGDLEWLDKWYSWHFDLGLFFSASQHSNCFSAKYCLSAQKKTTVSMVSCKYIQKINRPYLLVPVWVFLECSPIKHQ